MDHADQFQRATQLRTRFQESSTRFLLTELQAGLALLNVADTSQIDSFNERRRALAREAYDVVAEQLARISAEPFSIRAEVRDEIQRLHKELGDRLGL